ncbi:MAG: prolipoprotein diacylglyceryl transferase [Ruminococcaceae bacterium]|nr:prolipoprotein diacylglyceryl transferase [Oscillospiraceae bacterium]
MENLVTFPGLGIEIVVPRVAFTLFGAPIYWYGVLIGIGLLLALVFAFSQAKRFGLDPERMVDVIIVGFVLAIVCGRLYYVLFSDQTYATFFDVIDLRSGGIAIYGGIIGAFIGAVIACKWRKVALLPMLDLTAMGFLIGQAIGRWGNFFNQEAFGDNTAAPWGMISAETTAYLQRNQALLAEKGIMVDPAMPVHPTFLYESLWCALGFLLLFLWRKRRHFNGEILLFYVIWYGAGRFFIEGLRTDPLTVGSVRVSQVVAAASVVAGVVIWVIARRKTAGKPLNVPVVPPHAATVRLAEGRGPAAVRVWWPAYGKAPTREEKQVLAQEAAQYFVPADKTEAKAEAPQAEAPETKTEAKADAGQADKTAEEVDAVLTDETAADPAEATDEKPRDNPTQEDEDAGKTD